MKTNRTKSNEGTIVNSNPHLKHTPTLPYPCLKKDSHKELRIMLWPFRKSKLRNLNTKKGTEGARDMAQW